ncbi:hypothetical protein ACFRNT_10795 [Streptomyces sp. NPDC056697]|uniref:hypothetical protein n=1 Tax=Streptomyces sp. NPDC056697 TaxID=3345915 RepID=UPI00368419CD
MTAGDPGVFDSPMGGVMSRPQRADRSTSALVSVDSAVARARHDAVDMLVDAGVLTPLEKAVEEEKAGAKRAGRWRMPILSARLAQQPQRKGVTTTTTTVATPHSAATHRSAA